jgi:hypothetical protein
MVLVKLCLCLDAFGHAGVVGRLWLLRWVVMAIPEARLDVTGYAKTVGGLRSSWLVTASRWVVLVKLGTRLDALGYAGMVVGL